MTIREGSWLTYLLFFVLFAGGAAIAGVMIAVAADKGGYFVLLGAVGVVVGIASILAAHYVNERCKLAGPTAP